MHCISWINLLLCLIIFLTCTQSTPLPKISRKPKLIGGRPVRRGEAKYIVAIVDPRGICGGGIIGEKHILTAAHCIDIDKKTGTLLNPIQVIGGTNKAFGYIKSLVIERSVAKVYFPGLLDEVGHNDIAVLELSNPFNLQSYSEKLQKLNLPEPLPDNPNEYPTYEAEQVEFAGYGDTHAKNYTINGEMVTESYGSGPLKIAQALIDDAETCELVAENRPDQMCLSVNEERSRSTPQGTCTGDSGGPAVYNGNTVIGINSMGAHCDNNVFPSLFSRVSYYIPFIQKVLSGNTDGVLVYKAKPDCKKVQ